MKKEKKLEDMLPLKGTRKAVKGHVKKLGSIVKGIYGNEAEKLPDELSDAEKAGALVGKILGKCLETALIIADKYKKRPEGPLTCYKVVPRKSIDDDIVVRVDGKDSFVMWKQGKSYYAVIDSDSKASKELLDTYCVKKKEAPTRHYEAYLKKKSKEG
ncbi:MAG: hypothetical protein ABIB71_08835 [Candidatus Woesearchaeota archaeon]